MQKIVITGGSGYVGRSVCEQLAERWPACRLVVPTRRLANARHVQTLPTVDPVQADVHDPAAMAALLEGADALVQLVAILHGSEAEFDRVHVQLQRNLAAACLRARVPRVVQISALGVGAQAPSAYLRSKAAGEAVWQQSLGAGGAQLTILRPSVIFGADDRFTNLFAGLLKLAPVLPLAGTAARFQPVWVRDVADAVVRVLARPAAELPGPVIECAGPEVLTLAQIVERVGAMAGTRRPVVALPESLGLLQAAVLSLKPGEPLMSRDNVLSMRVPNVASGSLPGLQALGIVPQGLETLAPHFRPTDPRAR